MTRYKTYQYPWGFLTIDTQNETAPEGYSQEFSVNLTEASYIEDGAQLEVIEDELIVIPAESVDS